MASGPDDVAQHDVLRGLALVADGLDLVAGSPGWSMSDEQAREALLTVTRLSSRCRSVYLKLLADAAGRDVPAADRRAGKGVETTAWLAAERRMSVGRVRVDLAEARVLDVDDGDLRRLGSQLAAGAVTAEHAAVGVRALAAVPVTVRAELREAIDDRLTQDASTFAPPTTKTLARHLLAAVDPARADRFDADADQRRELFVATDATGMVIIRGQLEPAGGAAVKSMIEHLAAPHRGPGTEDEQGQTPVDRRSPAQRRADALTEMARLAAGNLDAGTRAGEPPRIVVHTSPEQIAAARTGGAAAFMKVPPGAATCEATGPISPTVLARLACDAVIDRIVLNQTGKVLEMTSLGRLFTAAQRRALAARDGGCTWPGCDRPPSWTDAHHVRFWTDGGPTSIDNGVLLCEPHHTTVHHGEWLIVIRDGVPWFTPPARIDPLRRPIRNTVHDAITANRRLGQQLHLNLPLRHRPDRR